MDFKINFSGRGHQYTDEEIQVVADTMQNAEPLTQGKYRDEFEKKFSSYIGMKYSYAVCNATAALEMAAQLCQLKDEDEVIAPSHTFTASVYPFAKRSAKIRWADIDLKERVVTAKTLTPLITSKTKVIIVVHLYGYVADMPAIMDLASKYNLFVVEDAAQSLGAYLDGKHSGSFGDFGIFSLHSHKNITTLGEGGILSVNDETLAKIIPMLRHNGHCNFDFERTNYWIPAMGNVDFPELNGEKLWPNNYCLGEVECALGTKLLDRLEKMNSEKRNRAIHFIDELRDFPELEFHRVDTCRHNYHLLIARVTNGKRDEFIKKMACEKRIKCVVQYYPLNRYPFYKKLGFGEANCPNADFHFDNMVSFPFQHWLTNAEFEYMLKSTQEVIRSMR